jgi:hypothetical protein
MSGEQHGGKPATTVKIIETVYVEAGTADDFKAVVQRLTGKDSSAAAPEPDAADRTAGTGRGGGSRGACGRDVGSPADVK